MSDRHPSVDAKLDEAAKAMFQVFARWTRPRKDETQTAAFERRWQELPDGTRREFRHLAEVAYGVFNS